MASGPWCVLFGAHNDTRPAVGTTTSHQRSLFSSAVVTSIPDCPLGSPVDWRKYVTRGQEKMVNIRKGIVVTCAARLPSGGTEVVQIVRQFVTVP